MNKIKPIVFVASPYAGDDQLLNIDFARRISRRISTETGAMPFAPHLLFPQFLNDQDEIERGIGIAYCSTMMAVAKFGAFFVPAWRREPSTGMRHEIAEADEIGLSSELVYDGRAGSPGNDVNWLIAKLAAMFPKTP